MDIHEVGYIPTLCWSEKGDKFSSDFRRKYWWAY